MCRGLGDKNRDVAFSPFYVMNHLSGINAGRYRVSKDFLLGCLDFLCFITFNFIFLVSENVFTPLSTGTFVCIVYFVYSGLALAVQSRA